MKIKRTTKLRKSSVKASQQFVKYPRSIKCATLDFGIATGDVEAIDYARDMGLKVTRLGYGKGRNVSRDEYGYQLAGTHEQIRAFLDDMYGDADRYLDAGHDIVDE